MQKHPITQTIRILSVKVLVRCVRELLQVVTVLRCPLLLSDPSALLTRLMEKCQARSAFAGLRFHPSPIRPEEDEVQPRMLVIVPFRNRWDLTQTALSSLLAQRVGASVHVALADNLSDEICKAKSRAWVNSFVSDGKGQASLEGSPAPSSPQPAAGKWTASLFEKNYSFNFSRMNNEIFQDLGGSATFDHVFFLNNDVELTDDRTLQKLLDASRSASQPLGAVGLTLLYPDRRVQHAFVAPGSVIVGSHPLKGIEPRPSYRWFGPPRVVPAVTGAALLVSASAFEAVGLFDEELPTAYQDVDLCLALVAQGLPNVVLTAVSAVHHESASRKNLPSLAETQRMYKKWGSTLTAHTLYPPELSSWSEKPALRLGEPAFPWKWFYPRG